MNKTRILFIFALLFTLGHAFATETWETKVRNILNDKTIDKPYERYSAATDTIRLNISDMSFEEGLRLFNDVLLSFVEKKMKGDSMYNKAKGNIYWNIFWVYSIHGYPGDYEENDAFFKKLVKKSDQLKDEFTRAQIHQRYGNFQASMGNISLAHEYYYKAIAICESINHYGFIFHCLYNIAAKQSQSHNIPGLRKIIDQMQNYIEQPSFSGDPECLYTLYSVQNIYYDILLEDSPEITAYKDSTLKTSRKLINLIENNREEIKRYPLGYVYYNMAVVYHDSYPDRYDSVYYFLSKALEFVIANSTASVELEINCYILYAELHFEQKRYKEAERDIFYALSLLEEHNNDYTDMEYTEIYKFLAKYYETLNRPAEALKYQKLLLENEKKRYDSERIAAMDDMLVKYETEKKQLQIETLKHENKTSRRIFLLTSSLLLALLIAAAFILFWRRLKLKNMEQELYETALLSELRQNELEKIQHNKQQLEQNPVKNIIDNIAQLISSSLIEKNAKEAYLERLSNLDAKLFETAYETSTIKITSMDMKYILCFAANLDVKDIGLLFNVDPASVYTVRYRVRKKLSKEDSFKIFL